MLRTTDRNADNNLEKKQQIERDPTSFQRSKVELIHDRMVESRDRRRKSKEVASMAALRCLALRGDQITVAYSQHDLTKTRYSNLGVSEFVKLAMHRLREPTVLNAFANVRGEVKEGREINLSVRLNRSLVIVSLCCRSARKDTSDLISSVFVHFVMFLLYVRLVSGNRDSKSSTSPRRRIATRRN